MNKDILKIVITVILIIIINKLVPTNPLNVLVRYIKGNR